MHQTSAYSSSPTSAVGADWDQPTGDARSVRTRKRTEQVKHDTQVNRNTRDRTLCTCRTVPKQCCRRQHFPLQCCRRHQLPYRTNTIRLPPHASGHQQCCGRQHLPYQANMVKPPTCLWVSTVWQAPTSAIPEEEDATSHIHLTLTVLWAPTIILYPTAWATRLSIRTLSLL